MRLDPMNLDHCPRWNRDGDQTPLMRGRRVNLGAPRKCLIGAIWFFVASILSDWSAIVLAAV